MPQYWLFKTEPSSFSIQDLAAAPEQTTFWDGVRNYQARNFLRDSIREGDRVLVYHSSADPPAVVGIARVVRDGYPDPSQWNAKSKYYDESSPRDNPRWFVVDIQLESIFDHPLPLEELRGVAALKEMELLRRGSRLSVQPVRKKEFDAIMKLAK